MDLSWLKDFIALGSIGGFSRAAEARGMTQPAFSRRIRALEEWLGVVLVNRDSHQVRLTPAGTRFLDIADATLRDLELGRREVRELADASRASLRLVATHALSVTFFPRWTRALQTRAGREFSVQLTADHMVAAEQLMTRGEAQFLLCHHHPLAVTTLGSRDFASIRLGEDRLVPVSAPEDRGVGPKHPLPGAADDPVSYLQFGMESGLGRIVTAVLPPGAIAGHLSPAFTSHAVMVLAAMARDGRGMAWLPLSLVEAELADGSVVAAGDDTWEIPIEVRLYRPSARQSPVAEAFWTAAADAASFDSNPALAAVMALPL